MGENSLREDEEQFAYPSWADLLTQSAFPTAMLGLPPGKSPVSPVFIGFRRDLAICPISVGLVASRPGTRRRKTVNPLTPE